MPSSHETAEIAIRLVRGVICARISSKTSSARRALDLCDLQLSAGRQERAGQPEVLRVGRHDVAPWPKAEPGDDDMHALGRRLGEREVRGRYVDLRGEQLAHPPAGREHLVEVRATASSVPGLPRA